MDDGTFAEGRLVGAFHEADACLRIIDVTASSITAEPLANIVQGKYFQAPNTQSDYYIQRTRQTRTNMSFNGVRLFRYALLAESAANTLAIVPMLLFPETVASFIFRGPNEITPGTKSLIQWYLPPQSLRKL